MKIINNIFKLSLFICASAKWLPCPVEDWRITLPATILDMCADRLSIEQLLTLVDKSIDFGFTSSIARNILGKAGMETFNNPPSKEDLRQLLKLFAVIANHDPSLTDDIVDNLKSFIIDKINNDPNFLNNVLSSQQFTDFVVFFAQEKGKIDKLADIMIDILIECTKTNDALKALEPIIRNCSSLQEIKKLHKLVENLVSVAKKAELKDKIEKVLYEENFLFCALNIIVDYNLTDIDQSPVLQVAVSDYLAIDLQKQDEASESDFDEITHESIMNNPIRFFDTLISDIRTEECEEDLINPSTFYAKFSKILKAQPKILDKTDEKAVFDKIKNTYLKYDIYSKFSAEEKKKLHMVWPNLRILCELFSEITKSRLVRARGIANYKRRLLHCLNYLDQYPNYLDSQIDIGEIPLKKAASKLLGEDHEFLDAKFAQAADLYEKQIKIKSNSQVGEHQKKPSTIKKLATKSFLSAGPTLWFLFVSSATFAGLSQKHFRKATLTQAYKLFNKCKKFYFTQVKIANQPKKAKNVGV